MKVLVMGGTQFNGLALVKELVRTGHDVTVLNRGQTKADLPRSVRRLTGDRTDHDGLRELFRKEEFDCVQDMTAYHPEDTKLMAEIFLGKTGHYIFASSTAIYSHSSVPPITEDHPTDRGEDQNEYGLHKLHCEDQLIDAFRAAGFPATIVPFSMVFGPNNIIPDREQRMFCRLLQGRPTLIPGDGTTIGQVGHVDDQARALRMMMGNPVTFGKRYNLTGKALFTDEGYVDVFADVLGVTPDKCFIPAELMDAMWDGHVDVAAGVQTQANIDIRSSGDESTRRTATIQKYRLSTLIQKLQPTLHRWNQSTFFSIDRLRADIGWEPEYTFRSMIEQTYDWFLSEGLDESREFDWTFEDDILARLES